MFTFDDSLLTYGTLKPNWPLSAFSIPPRTSHEHTKHCFHCHQQEQEQDDDRKKKYALIQHDLII